VVLLIDNYDSFTFNLYDYILQSGEECLVIRNDEMTIEEIKHLDFNKIVISPGPGKPLNAGICTELIKEFYQSKAILGICLGHQAIGEFFHAKLCKAIQPMHGKTSTITTKPHPIFKELPQQMEVMRYHSLILEDVKYPLEIIANTKQGEIMAIAHQDLPISAVQFHPESILTPHGLQIIKNWIEWTK